MARPQPLHDERLPVGFGRGLGAVCVPLFASPATRSGKSVVFAVVESLIANLRTVIRCSNGTTVSYNAQPSITLYTDVNDTESLRGCAPIQ